MIHTPRPGAMTYLKFKPMVALQERVLRRVSEIASPGNTRLNSQSGEFQEVDSTKAKPKGFDSDAPVSENYVYGVDWLNLVLVFPSIEEMKETIDWVMVCLRDKLPWADPVPWFNGRYFESSYWSIGGARIGFNRLEGGVIDCYVSINGSALAPAGLWSVSRAMVEMSPYAVRCTRMDAYLDDHTREIGRLRSLMLDAFYSHNVSGFRSMQERVKHTYERKQERTLYLGSRASTRILRIYDKPGLTRAEAELKDSTAWFAYSEFVRIASEDEPEDIVLERLGAFLRSLVTSGYDFVEKKSKNLDRNKRLGWWKEYLTKLKAKPIKIKREQPRRSFERSVAFIERQVETTLAMFFDTWGMARFHKFIEQCLVSGRKRYSAMHYAMIEQEVLMRYKIKHGHYKEVDLELVM